MAAPLTFTLTREPVSPFERRLFRDDLARMDLDETGFDLWDMLLGTGTRDARPMILRGYSGDDLAGVAMIEECRRTGKAMFDNPVLVFFLDNPALPSFYWELTASFSDGHANPGFVTGAIERQDFVEQAITYLNARYHQGCTLDYSDRRPDPSCTATLGLPAGSIVLDGVSQAMDLYLDSRNLTKKTKKFANKGGTIERHAGRLGGDLVEAALKCLRSNPIQIRTAFQDNYENMVRAGLLAESDRHVHFVARLEDDVVGYHSFARIGSTLACLSGAFDRTRHTTYHAYENLYLVCIDFAIAQGCRTIQTGPVVNPTKAKIVNRQEATELRFHSRHALIRGLLPTLLKYSKLRPSSIARITGQQG